MCGACCWQIGGRWRKCLCFGVPALLLALQNPWKAESAWSPQFAEPWYRTRLASGFGYSQNQSQGIELDVHKEKVCAETEGMGPAEVVADGWLCGEEATGRGGLAGGVV